MKQRTLQDVYRCPHCGAIAARGNCYCRGCGVQFSREDVAVMEDNLHSPIGALPWNTRDRFRCVHCQEFVAIYDSYCRGCGDEIEDHERQLMRLKLSELAKQNTPALIGLGVVVLLIVWAAILLVR
jgi:predicted amidophosphoribosyltransferase